MSTRVLVTGASVAGPTAAAWLARSGFEVTVLERSPRLRTGGQNVDVRGSGRDVVRRMGVEDAVRGEPRAAAGRVTDADGQGSVTTTLRAETPRRWTSMASWTHSRPEPTTSGSGVAT